MNKTNLRVKILSKNIQNQPKPKQSKQILSFHNFLSQSANLISQKNKNALHKLQHKLKDTPTTFIVPQQLKKQHIIRLQQRQKITKSISKSQNKSKQKNPHELSQPDQQKLKQLMIRKQELMQKLRKIDYNLMNPRAQNRQVNSLTNQSKITQRSRLYHKQKSDLSTLKLKQDNIYDVNKHQKTMQMLSRLNNQKLKRQQKIISTMKIKQLTQLKKIEDIERNRSQLSLSRNIRQSNVKINRERQNQASQRIRLPQFDQISQIQAENVNQFQQLQPSNGSNREKETINQYQNQNFEN